MFVELGGGHHVSSVVNQGPVFLGKDLTLSKPFSLQKGRKCEGFMYVGLKWAFLTPLTILAVGLDEELSHLVNNCKIWRLLFQVSNWN
jgi:hypothetical protein